MDSEPLRNANPTLGGTLSAPNATTPWLGRDEEVAKVEIGVLATVLVLAVLLTLGQPGRKRSRMHLFVLHLALTDLAVALFQVLPQLLWDITFRFQGPDLLCRAVKYLQVLSMFASTYMLLAMTLDRYLAVCHPLRSLQQPDQATYPLIAAPWLLAAILSLPQVFIFSLKEVSQGSGVLDCWADFRFPWGPRVYLTWTTLAIFILPVTILTACYSLICHEICKNLKVKTQAWRVGGGNWRRSPSAPVASTRGLPSRVSSISTISRAKIRTVKMTFVIVLAYIACWAPFFSVQMWSVWDENASHEGNGTRGELVICPFIEKMVFLSLSQCRLFCLPVVSTIIINLFLYTSALACIE
ncbi:Vasopressin V1b receptor [Saguinus oedipus]|uniref:Vasopressin V1b receptor n=1 Tax=Saguinus oedipus TaxID=9490 RepID=A0ABQ9TP17_SAGOE|nr:Vasopressin V1b receptor [Saguinus oedipus]